MDTSIWLIAFIPAIAFGFIPVVGSAIGGKAVQQSMGIAIGSLLFSIVALFVHAPQFTPQILLVSFLSGVFWAVGSIGQFQGIDYMGVARSTPVLNGGQIIGTSLVGICLGEWPSVRSKLLGFSALTLIILGIVFTSYRRREPGRRSGTGKGIIINAIGALGFTAYAGILKYYRIDGWDSILPQSIGQLTALAIAATVIFRVRPFAKVVFKNSVVGIIWGVGNIALLLSQAGIGLAVAYPISQAGVIVSILGGTFINKEHKTRREWLLALVGMALISVGLYLIYLSAR